MARIRYIAILLTFLLILQAGTVAGASQPASVNPDVEATSTTTPQSPSEWVRSLPNASENTSNSVTPSSHSTGNSTEESLDIQATYNINRTPDRVGTVRVTYLVEIPHAVNRFTIYPGDAHSNVSAPGFTKVGDHWTWFKSSFGRTTLHFNYTVSATTSDQFGTATIDNSEWAFLRYSQLAVTVGWDTLRSADYWPEYTETMAPDGDGYIVRDEWVYLGPYTKTTIEKQNQTFTYVQATGANPPVQPQTVAESLSKAGRDLTIGAVDSSVVIFVLPSPPMRGGGAAYDTSFWISDDIELEQLTWHHEYVHTRQAHRYIGSPMAWLTEGSAEYFSGYLVWQQGHLTDDEFREYIGTTEGSSTVLSELDSDAPEAYTKGRRVLAALDAEIREATDGQHSLLDVFRILNTQYESSPSLTEFETTAENVSDRSFDSWFDLYIRGDNVPPTPSLDVYSLEPPRESRFSEYAGDDNILQTGEILEIIDLWSRGEFSTAEVLTAVDYWTSGTPVS